MTSSETPGYTFKLAILLAISTVFLVSVSFNSLQGLYFSIAAHAIQNHGSQISVIQDNVT